MLYAENVFTDFFFFKVLNLLVFALSLYTLFIFQELALCWIIG